MNTSSKKHILLGSKLNVADIEEQIKMIPESLSNAKVYIELTDIFDKYNQADWINNYVIDQSGKNINKEELYTLCSKAEDVLCIETKKSIYILGSKTLLNHEYVVLIEKLSEYFLSLLPDSSTKDISSEFSKSSFTKEYIPKLKLFKNIKYGI